VKSVSLIAALAAAITIAPVAAQSQAAPSAVSKTASKPKYKRDLPAKLVKEAKISEAVAAEAALKAVPGGKISSVELEKEDGKFIYSYDIKAKGKSGIDEVHVDAMTGAVISNVHETPKDEKAEAAKEAKEKAAKPKKP
jgi:uncharacterized membrane protein YkoI